MVDSFNDEGIVFQGGAEPETPPEDKTVDKMANRATQNALK